MKYKVLFHNGISFNTFAEAKLFADHIFSRIGIVPHIIQA